MKKIKNVDNKFLGCVLKYAIGGEVGSLKEQSPDPLDPVEYLKGWHKSQRYTSMMNSDPNMRKDWDIYSARGMAFGNMPELEVMSGAEMAKKYGRVGGGMAESSVIYDPKTKKHTYNPNSAAIWNSGFSPFAITHEYSHVTDPMNKDTGEYLLPSRDINVINKIFNSVPQSIKNKEGFEYYKKPTEVRARVNAIRHQLYNNGFDVFNKKIDSNTLNKNKSNLDFQYKELKSILNDDQILELLNTITQDSLEKVPIAQEGMFINNPNQYAPQQGVGGMYGASINGAPLPAVSNKFVNEQNKMIEYQNKLKRQDISAAEQKLKPITNVLNVAAAVPVVGAPASAVLAGMDFAKGDTTSGIINTAGAVAGGALKGITGVGKGVTNAINASDKALDAYSKYGAYNLITGPSGGSSNYINQVSSTPIDSINSNVQNPNLFSSNPISPKKAIKVPTVNAKMELGGFTEGDEVELSESDYKRLIKMGYEIEEI